MALATAVILSLFASYFVAMTVVPLYCAKLVKKHEADEEVGEDVSLHQNWIVKRFNFYFESTVEKYDRTLAASLLKPFNTVVGLAGISLLSLSLYPFLGVSFFPRTDPGQFVINLKAPSGTRVELTEDYVKQVEKIVHQVVPASDLQLTLPNIRIPTH